MKGGGSWKEGKAKEGMEGGEMMEGCRTRKGGGATPVALNCKKRNGRGKKSTYK